MLLFECTLESAGGALVLTVILQSVFAGEVVTCTDGITTLTQSCPSTSPYTVDFKIPNGGLWTVSANYNGSTISETVDIPSSVELNPLPPTGSTVTPTDDIQTWLHCAGIWNKNYTTISQVLNDGATVTALIASSNAVDYMVRSTTWATDTCADSSCMTKIGANDYCADTLLSDSTWLNAICDSVYFESVLTTKVPTMTSNYTPSGHAECSQTYGASFAAWKAFDGNTAPDVGIAFKSGSSNNYIQYQFTSAVKVYKVMRMPRWVSGGLVNPAYIFKVMAGSGSLSDIKTNINWSDQAINAWSSTVISNPPSATTWRIQATDGLQGDISEVQFYGRE